MLLQTTKDATIDTIEGGLELGGLIGRNVINRVKINTLSTTTKLEFLESEEGQKMLQEEIITEMLVNRESKKVQLAKQADRAGSSLDELQKETAEIMSKLNA